MKNIKPLKDKVLGRMIDGFGMRTTSGGLVVIEKDKDETSIRPRWFEVTHVGLEQTDVSVGQYVLLPHGRWSRGIDIDGTHRDEDKLFLLDHTDILGVQNDNPINPTT